MPPPRAASVTAPVMSFMRAATNASVPCPLPHVRSRAATTRIFFPDNIELSVAQQGQTMDPAAGASGGTTTQGGGGKHYVSFHANAFAVSCSCPAMPAPAGTLLWQVGWRAVQPRTQGWGGWRPPRTAGCSSSGLTMARDGARPRPIAAKQPAHLNIHGNTCSRLHKCACACRAASSWRPLLPSPPSPPPPPQRGVTRICR